jgi:hypothetical protein
MKKKVLLSDGLGNQMFQVAFAFYMIKKGFKVELDEYKIKSGEDAVYDLIDIKISVKDSIIKKLIFNINLILKFKFKTKFVISQSRQAFIQKTPFDSKIDYNMKIFEGYFQNRIFFEACQDDIKGLTLLKTSTFFNEFLDKISENSCAIHFRGGDYKSAGFHILDSSYYSKAVSEMDSLGIDEYFIFTSDEKFARNIVDGLNSNSKFSFFKHPEGLDHEELYIMSRFKNIIIANSTFSLWSAYLGSNQRVIGPSRWINDEINPENTLYLTNWKII